MARALPLLVGLLVLAATAQADEAPAVAVGAKVGEALSFVDVRGLTRSLGDLGEREAAVLVFLTEDCPLARRALPRLVALEAATRDRGARFLLVDVGRDAEPTAAAALALNHGVGFPIVLDPGRHGGPPLRRDPRPDGGRPRRRGRARLRGRRRRAPARRRPGAGARGAEGGPRGRPGRSGRARGRGAGGRVRRARARPARAGADLGRRGPGPRPALRRLPLAGGATRRCSGATRRPGSRPTRSARSCAAGPCRPGSPTPPWASSRTTAG